MKRPSSRSGGLHALHPAALARRPARLIPVACVVILLFVLAIERESSLLGTLPRVDGPGGPGGSAAFAKTQQDLEELQKVQADLVKETASLAVRRCKLTSA